LTGFDGSEEIGGADVRVCAGVHIPAYVCIRMHRGQERRRARERGGKRERERINCIGKSSSNQQGWESSRRYWQPFIPRYYGLKLPRVIVAV